MSEMLILPHLDISRGRQTVTVDPGTNVASMVALAFPGIADYSKIRVVIGDRMVPQHQWHLVRPRPGNTVIIRVVPGNDPLLRSVLTVAVLVAAVALGQFYAPGIAGAVVPFGVPTAATISTVAALSTATFALAGTALLNAFIPASGLGDQGSGTSVNGITGLQNTSNPGGVIPSILGTHRYAPVYAAPPYTEIIGDDQYVIAAFLFGHGPLNFANHKLGETTIEAFSDVEMEVRQGLPGDMALTLYPRQVLEEQLTVTLEPNVLSYRTTARDVSGGSVDFTFVQGLVFFDDRGNPRNTTVTVRIFYREVGDASFTEILPPGLDMTAGEQKIIRRTLSFSFPERGQYEIAVQRVTNNPPDAAKRIDKCTWSALRGFRPESPFNYPAPLAMVAMRIRASDQLNGIVNNYNAEGSVVCKDWDSATQTWIVRETNNPASLYRHVLQGPANVFPKTDDQIDLQGLQDWHDFCIDKNLKYDRVHDYDGSRLDVLKDIAAAGRATPHDDGEKWGVTVDRPKTTYVSAVSPRNSWDFQGSTSYVLFPDAHRVQFIDATNGWNQAERIVPFPGIDPDAVEITEDLKHPGVTDPDQIWKATRRRQYELLHRRHSYTVSQDFESLVLARGDLVPLNHDVLDRDHVAARVRSVSGQTVTLDTEVTMEARRSYALIVRSQEGESIRRTSLTVPGTIATLQLVGDLTGIAAGDLAMFGTSLSGPAIDVIVKSIERGDNLTAKLTLLDAAPQIDTLTDADIPPAWDGRVGGDIDVSGLVPAVPNLSVTDSFLQFDAAVSAGTGSVAVPTTFVISYRPHGGGAFTAVSIPAAQGVLHIGGFVVGDVIDVKAHAVSAFGQASVDTAIVQATLHLAATNSPTFDSISHTFDLTVLTMDHF